MRSRVDGTVAYEAGRQNAHTIDKLTLNRLKDHRSKSTETRCSARHSAELSGQRPVAGRTAMIIANTNDKANATSPM